MYNDKFLRSWGTKYSIDPFFLQLPSIRDPRRDGSQVWHRRNQMRKNGIFPKALKWPWETQLFLWASPSSSNDEWAEVARRKKEGKDEKPLFFTQSPVPHTVRTSFTHSTFSFREVAATVGIECVVSPVLWGEAKREERKVVIPLLPPALPPPPHFSSP